MSYLPSALISIIAHAVLIFLIVKGVSFYEQTAPKHPVYIKATLVDLKTQAQASSSTPTNKSKPQQADIEKQNQQQKMAQEQVKLEQAKLEQAKKEKAALLKKQQEENEKQLKEKQLKEKQVAEQQKREQEEKERKERERQVKQSFEEQLAQEKQRLNAELEAEALAQQAQQDQLLSQSYASIIRQRVEENWSRPLSARKSMEAELSIVLIPTGEVIDVIVTKSSGNSAFDQSAVQAVKKVGQFEALKTMPSRLFEKEFRKFKLVFKPQDLRL